MNFLKHKKDVFFVSSIDRFLAEFDRTHPEAASQLAESKKAERVIQQRDYNPFLKNIMQRHKDLMDGKNL